MPAKNIRIGNSSKVLIGSAPDQIKYLWADVKKISKKISPDSIEVHLQEGDKILETVVVPRGSGLRWPDGRITVFDD